MKKIFYFILGLITVMGTSSCSDFLDQTSPSEADVDFVFSDQTSARAALQKAYEQFRSSSLIHSGGLFYELVVSSSDTECQPESYSAQLNRWIGSNFYGYDDGNFNENFRGTENYVNTTNGDYKAAWNGLYTIISITNTLINNFQNSAEFKTMMAQGKPSDLSQIYGEAVALRATCYYELTRYYGDVPHQLVSGEAATHFDPRDAITDYHIAQLEKVEPLMYRPGESSTLDVSYMNRTYVQGLIARMAMWEGGYQTRRTDLGDSFYKDYVEGGDSTVVQFDIVSQTPRNKCFYGRRKDWNKYYQIAETYLKSAYENSGSVKLHVTDSRTNGAKEYGNPFQEVFQKMNDLQFSDEAVFEVPESQGVGQERPYAFGRPSNGGGSNSYPCKTYDQSRFHPLYYYDDFDPKDLRRDATCTVTGSTGTGAEAMVNFTKGSRLNGGIANNKWDENRMANPYTSLQRKAGINAPYMRFADIILMYAEVRAALYGDGDALAKSLYTAVRARAFRSAADANIDGTIAKNGSLLAAIIDERKFEFGGEGSRKWDVIRTNSLSKIITSFHARATAMINDLRTKGYHVFENGNVISNYIWVKTVDAKTQYGYRLTTQCPLGKESDPVLYPSWRGQNDDWAAVAAANGTPTKSLTAGSNTNVAIQGLFRYIDPDGEEAKSLEADGYKKTKWGADIIDEKTKNYLQYNELIYNGYVEGEAPVYQCCIHADVVKNSNGVLHNGYGFQDK